VGEVGADAEVGISEAGRQAERVDVAELAPGPARRQRRGAPGLGARDEVGAAQGHPTRRGGGGDGAVLGHGRRRLGWGLNWIGAGKGIRRRPARGSTNGHARKRCGSAVVLDAVQSSYALRDTAT
jgi:hypothetical protein